MSDTKTKNVERKKAARPHATMISAVLTISSAALSAGVIGIPLGYANAGFANGIALTLFTIVLSCICGFYIVYIADALAVYSMGGVCCVYLLIIFLF